MARTIIPNTASKSHGTLLAAAAAADVSNGNYIQNDGSTRLHAKNTNGASTARTVTIAIPATVDGQSVTSITQAIAAGATWVFGPFPVSVYGTQVSVNGDNAELFFHTVQ